MRTLLDTNVVSDLVRNPEGRVTQRIRLGAFRRDELQALQDRPGCSSPDGKRGARSNPRSRPGMKAIRGKLIKTIAVVGRHA
jgi:hypothetical protein